ncbi:MAG: secretin N-terminal domain-containing protein [Candidatus Babeliales bacterium]
MNNKYINRVLAFLFTTILCAPIIQAKGLLLASRDELEPVSAISTEHNAGSKNSTLTNSQTPDQTQQGAASTVASNAADTKVPATINVPVSTKKSVLLADQGDQDIHEVNLGQSRLPLELEKEIQQLPAMPPKTPQQVQKDARKSVMPVMSEGEQEATIEFHFEDADLNTLLTYMSDVYNVTFITNDILTPLPKVGKGVSGNKISFKTFKPLTKKTAWSLFVSFLDMAGLTLVPDADPTIFKVVQTELARKSPIPAFIGTKPDALPDTDQLVRYVYFVENASITTMKDIVESLRSTASAFLVLNELNAFLLTDKAYNIKSLMKIVTELDRTTLPQAMSVLKLRRADAQEVKNLYDGIIQTDDQSAAGRLFPARKQPTTLYFPENTRMIAEPRSNSLILLGTPDAIKKIEDFIVNYVDVDIGKMHSPLRVYTLKYADAVTVSNIMTEVTQFGKNTPAGQVGGVRDNDKYLKTITFTPEPSTNRIIIKGEEEDYLRAKEILDALDSSQPQVAVEVLIISLDLERSKILGAQLRSKQSASNPATNGNPLKSVQFQTSGSLISGSAAGIVTNSAGTGVERLLGNLINLVNGSFGTSLPGNTVVSLGTDFFGVWGIFNILETISNAQVVSNPFLVATNKKKATVSVGQRRRVVAANVVGATTQESFANDDANLTVSVTPQINSDGMIVLDLDVQINTFTDQTNFQDATKNTQEIKTTSIVADKEVLALGGLIRTQITNTISQVPLLGNLPIVGWLFKNKSKQESKTNLLILISTRIVRPHEPKDYNGFTQERIKDYHGDLTNIEQPYTSSDPIHKLFFAAGEDSTEKMIDNYLFNRNKKHKKKKNKGVNKPSEMRKAAGNEIVIGQNTPKAEPAQRVISPGSATTKATTVAQNTKQTTVPTRTRSSSLLNSPDTNQGVHA